MIEIIILLGQGSTEFQLYNSIIQLKLLFQLPQILIQFLGKEYRREIIQYIELIMHSKTETAI